MRTVTDTCGNKYRVDQVIKDTAAARAQIYPGFVAVMLTPCDARNFDTTSHHISIQLRREIADQWIAGTIRVYLYP
jgi:hypothetical protein